MLYMKLHRFIIYVFNIIYVYRFSLCMYIHTYDFLIISGGIDGS